MLQPKDDAQHRKLVNFCPQTKVFNAILTGNALEPRIAALLVDVGNHRRIEAQVSARRGKGRGLNQSGQQLGCTPAVSHLCKVPHVIGKRAQR